MLGTPLPPVLTVSLLNRQVPECLEAGFPLCWVAGEVSNLTYAASGHVYFTLKDATAQVRCVLWRSRAQTLGRRLETGERLEVRALVSFYEPRGEFQLSVEAVRSAGQGELYERFLRLKATLEEEGLFAPAAKRPLPAFPRRLAIVTSPQAAALHDVLSTLTRRAPHLTLTLYPTPVQGDGAAALAGGLFELAGVGIGPGQAAAGLGGLAPLQRVGVDIGGQLHLAGLAVPAGLLGGGVGALEDFFALFRHDRS
jgi:exodeoxyribonuclease VII large subunit